MSSHRCNRLANMLQILLQIPLAFMTRLVIDLLFNWWQLVRKQWTPGRAAAESFGA
ncbi:hypothetical protein ETAA8_30490 [Anatilimnocola aggregata]|uniref:Uncharacterized protein n=1 Tax=Anatilimnocola aggregata TaxID=2528021 RepID=A0A517YCJ0_9BACT|nr:hypothetical protein ETAA8_30490 [Anatilimnocola aggregata]